MAGQPTKYRDKYIKQMLDFFSVAPVRRKIIKTIEADGRITTREGGITHNRLPTFERFAVLEVGVCTDTLAEWARVKTKAGGLRYPLFSATYKRCKELQKNFLIECGAYGLFNPSFTKFIAMNITDMRDRREVDHTTAGERISGINYIAPTEGQALV